MDRPLAGLSVLEAGDGVAIRYCGRLFAQLGADVRWLGARQDEGLGYAGAAGAAYGQWLDHGKRRAGDEALADPGLDLVIGGQDPAALARLESRLHGSPRPVLLALTWFGLQGPYAGWRGTDETIAALVGLAFGFGAAEGPPMLAQGHGPQLTGGLTAFNAALAALLAPVAERPRRIEVNVHEAAMCFTETGAITTEKDRIVSRRLGVNRFSPTYPCASYRTADGWVGVTCLIPAQWRALCDLIGRPELAREPRFATSYERLMLADEVDAVLIPALAARTTAQWVADGIARRIPITPMPRPSELPQVDHWRARDSFAAIAPGGPLAPTLPFRMRFDGAAEPFRPGGGGGPLNGLKVVDFSMGWAGPLCTRTLGDLGAEVIKIESHGHPDWWRGWEADVGGDPPPTEIRLNFIAVNRNKLGVALELTESAELEQARRLIAQSDVVVENLGPGVLDKLGLGQAEQRRLRPGLISVSMPAFGNGGPLSGLRAYGSTVEQASGLPFVNGEAAWPPCLQHVAFGDPLAGLYAAAAVLAALHGRVRLGGAEVDLAQVACLFQFAADAIVAEQVAGGPVPRTGSRRARAAPVCVAAAAGEEAWLAVAVDGEPAWRGLCAALGRNDWSSDADLETVEGRQRRAREIETAIAAWARDLAPGEAARRLQARGVPAAPVRRTSDLSGDPQLEAGGFWTWMERRHVGRHRQGNAPFAYDGERPPLRLPAPVLGEHTGQVLGRLSAPVASRG